MSNLLKRALRLSIAPAILIIAIKILGILLLSSVYDFDIQIGNDLNHTFSTQIYISNEQDALFLNSVTDALTLFSLILPLLYMILKISISQSSKRNPRTVVRLTKANLLKWVAKDDTNFLKVFIWTAFLWIISALVVVNTLQMKTNLVIGITAAVCTLIATWGVLHVFEIESNKVYPEEGGKLF